MVVRLSETQSPLIGLGMTSLVLGIIGLMLFFMPILGIPISVLGLLFSFVALPAVLVSGGSTLRWSLGGIGVCSLALLANIAILYAPSGYIPSRDQPPYWQQPYDRPYVPPPAD
jgi:hypothetical protein